MLENLSIYLSFGGTVLRCIRLSTSNVLNLLDLKDIDAVL